MTVQIKVDTTEVQQGLKDLSNKLSNLKPMFRGIGDYMTRSILARFDKGVDANGKPWAPLSSVTIKSKSNPKVLQESGRLKNSITYEATDSQVEIGTSSVLAYDAIHQFGGQAGPSRKVRIPARPYLGVSQGDESMVQRIIQNHLEG